jgi:hypothetical protein
MAISEYINSSTGEKLFKVRIKRRSPKEAGLSIDKREQGFKTKVEAERAEKKLFIQAERELTEAEQKTCLWENLVDEWEVNARQGDIFIRALSPQTIDDYTFIIRDHCKEWMRLHVDEIDRARAWMVLDRVEREISISRRKRLRTAIDAVFKWGILAGKLKGLTVIPTDGFKSMLKEEEKMPEILNLGQIKTLLDYAEKEKTTI